MGLDRARWDSLVGACPTHRVEAAGGEHRRKRRRGFLKAVVVVRKSTEFFATRSSRLRARLALAQVSPTRHHRDRLAEGRGCPLSRVRAGEGGGRSGQARPRPGPIAMTVARGVGTRSRVRALARDRKR